MPSKIWLTDLVVRSITVRSGGDTDGTNYDIATGGCFTGQIEALRIFTYNGFISG